MSQIGSFKEAQQFAKPSARPQPALAPQALQERAVRLDQISPRRPPRLASRQHFLGEPQDLTIDAYAVSLGETLDLAEGWDCENGPDCENRAHAGELFGSVAEAEAAAPRNATERAARLVRGSPTEAYRRLYLPDGPEPLNIVHVHGVLASCFDYREVGCKLADAFRELRLGAGDGEAWKLVRSHRREYGALSVLLPGSDPQGQLFAFVSGCQELKMTPAAVVELPRT